MRLSWALAALSCACWSFAQACGGDGGVDIDASTDGTTGGDNIAPPPPDSGGQDVVVDDTGTGDTGTTSDAGDAGTTPDSSSTGLAYRCGNDGGTVTDCSQCTGATQPCAYCGTADASVLLGICTPLHTNCFNAIPSNQYQDCPCPMDASTCPESYQICASGGGGRCHTCSDNQNNNGLKCENGGTCNSTDGGCI